jgi:dihydrodipicolinate synthase/N-acetylneuraminate lyase
MPTNKQFRGVYSIPVTPFDEQGAVDYASLRRCVEFCVEAGADGIVMPVNASEGPTLSDAERDKVTRTAIKAAAGAVPFVAGVSGASPQHSIEMAKGAAGAGADSLIAMPPQNAAGAQTYDFYCLLAEASRLPIWIQNNRPPYAPTVPTDMMLRLLKESPTIKYVKEESLLPGQVMTRLFTEAGTSVKGVMGGMGGRYLIDEYRRGACGTMPAGHITDAHAKLWAALEKGKDGQELPKGSDPWEQPVSDEARQIWEEMMPSLNFEFLFGVSAYKAAFWRRGIIKTMVTRIPSGRPLDRLDMEELDVILDRMGGLLTWKKRRI